MNENTRSPEGEALTDAVLDLFRLNSTLTTAGDRLVAHLGLTSARWQILGAMAAAQRPQPVSWLARDLGANRQNIQRIVNDLVKDGLVDFESNPHHRRAQLVVFTPKGRDTLEAAMQLQAPWISQIAAGIPLADLHTFHQMVLKLRAKLELMGTDA